MNKAKKKQVVFKYFTFKQYSKKCILFFCTDMKWNSNYLKIILGPKCFQKFRAIINHLCLQLLDNFVTILDPEINKNNIL
jgi:hypothetical protein